MLLETFVECFSNIKGETMLTTVHRIALRFSLAYLIESNSGLVLVDAGVKGEEQKILRKITEVDGGDLRLIFITHAHLDHYGSAAALKRITGAPIAIHHLDEEAMALGETRLGSARNIGRILAPLLPLANALGRPEPAKADFALEDGDVLGGYGLDARVLYTPGHTYGSSCLVVEDSLAFVGDLVTNTNGPHLQRAFAQDWSSLTTSLNTLRAMEADWLFPGHGPKPMKGIELENL
jgi:glyoxylase-like metal-dependent hydrolase (beta-lactamase superfamily II)